MLRAIFRSRQDGTQTRQRHEVIIWATLEQSVRFGAGIGLAQQQVLAEPPQESPNNEELHHD